MFRSTSRLRNQKLSSACCMAKISKAVLYSLLLNNLHIQCEENVRYCATLTCMPLTVGESVNEVPGLFKCYTDLSPSGFGHLYNVWRTTAMSPEYVTKLPHFSPSRLVIYFQQQVVKDNERRALPIELYLSMMRVTKSVVHVVTHPEYTSLYPHRVNNLYATSPRYQSLTTKAQTE